MNWEPSVQGKNFGFVSTRFAGTDGVSLESAKWAEVLWRHGHVSYWCAGKLDTDPHISTLIPEAYFEHESNREINLQIFGKQQRSRACTGQIHALRKKIKAKLYEFIQQFKIDVLVAENCLTIPMHVPLGLALTEVIAETGIPTIAHHHDFFWERDRFALNAVPEFIQMAFPPRLQFVRHVVINTAAQEQLAYRAGCSSTIIPNVVDFDVPPPAIDAYSSTFRKDIGLKTDDVLILQPTRLVSRKGIEHAVELVRRLGEKKYKLVVSHDAGDEGFEYQNFLMEYAASVGVNLHLVSRRLAEKRTEDSAVGKRYTLWDVYPHADMVTYPSLYEGFGNAFLEAIYFRKPLLVNRYSIYIRDIEPKGFRVIEMDGFLTSAVVEEVRRVLTDAPYRQEIVNQNFELAKRHFSYNVLEQRLGDLVSNIFGL